MTEILIPKAFQDIFKPYRYKCFYGGRGSGKCLDPNTPVVYADGSIHRAGDVRPGHLLMGQDSTPRRVLNAHRGWDDMYRVTQNAAMDYVVNSQHTLVLKKTESAISGGRYPQYGAIAEVPVLELLHASKRFKEHFHGYKVGWELPERPVDIEPYFLGLWLGDGDTDTQRITTADAEVNEYLTEYARTLNCKLSIYDKRQKSSSLSISKTSGLLNPLLQKMKGYGLIGNKHIPDEYMRNSRKVRMELLAGILDSDAHVERGCAYLSAKKRAFLEQVKLLADSLGFKTSKTITCGMAKCNGKLFEFHKLTISGNLQQLPFRIARRIAGAKATPNKDFLKTSINVQPEGEGAYVGFEVDGDHCFLLGDGTVCHNSHTVARYILIRAMQSRVRVLCTRELQNSISESVFKLFEELIVEYELQDLFYSTQTSITCTLTNSEFIFAGIARNTSALKSMEAIDIAWVEEAHSVTQRSWELLLPTIRKPGSEIVVTFNPADDDDPCYERFVKNKPDNALVRLVNYCDNPWFPEVLRIEMETMRERDPDLYEHVWMGQPRFASDAQIFNGKWRVEEFTAPPGVQFLFGMDWGFGPDPTVLVRCYIHDDFLWIDYSFHKHNLELKAEGEDSVPHHIATVPQAHRYPIMCDPTRPESITFLRNPQNGGYDCQPAKRWEGSVEDGIEFIRGFKGIVIHPRNEGVISDFKRFSYKIDKKTDKILPVIVEKYDDAIAALRYALVDYIQKRATIFYKRGSQ